MFTEDAEWMAPKGNATAERMTATLANGRRYRNDYCFFFELADDGRIARLREYMDTRLGHECIFGAPAVA